MGYAHDMLTPEDRERLGLGVPPPKDKTLTEVARATGIPLDELEAMRGVRNRDDFDPTAPRWASSTAPWWWRATRAA